MRSLNLVPALATFVVGSTLVSGAAFAALGDNEVGINVHGAPPAIAQAAAALGVGWVRLDGNWFILEPRRDRYEWGSMDTSVAAAHAQGLKVFISLAYTPSWEPRHGDTNGSPNDDVPNDSAQWVQFVRDAVTRYRGMGVTHFGMWNEPNLSQFFEGTVAEYASLIAVPGAAAVRAVCNDCVVLGPDLAHLGDVDDWLEELFQRIPIDTFDIVAHHTYHGFPETGVEIWDNDRFFNVLDQRRFRFTRRSIKEVLDAAGWQGEVWITETGYRASPVGQAATEAEQAIYVRRVLEEQLARAWYTNTFFYEILDCRPLQPNCDIDGFGLMRFNGTTEFATATFPDDFRLKPAWHALSQFIAQNPQLSGRQPATACGDGDDNDRDGRVDLMDRGCADGADEDESDDPPRLRLEGFRTPGITVDGDLSDFGADGWVTLGDSSWRGTEPLGAGDLSVRVAARWSTAGIYLGFDVTDDVHDNDRPDAELWQADSVQIAFDVGQSGGDAYDAVDDHEINVALSNGASRIFRFQGPSAATNDFEVAVARSGSRTSYEVLLRGPSLPSASLSNGSVVGLSFVVNDNDGAGRIGWIEWTRGIGNGKAPYWFGALALSSAFSPMAPPPGDAGAGAPDSGAGALDASVTDTGIVADSGVRADTGSMDAGQAAVDSGATTDAGRVVEDSGVQGASPVPDSSGCGCTAADSADSPRPQGRDSDALVFAALFGLFLTGRRRRG